MTENKKPDAQPGDPVVVDPDGSTQSLAEWVGKTVQASDVPTGTPVAADQDGTNYVAAGPLIGSIIVNANPDLTAEQVGDRLRKVVSLGGAHRPREPLTVPTVKLTDEGTPLRLVDPDGNTEAVVAYGIASTGPSTDVAIVCSPVGAPRPTPERLQALAVELASPLELPEQPEWRPPLIEMDGPETAPVRVQVKYPDGIADLFVRSAARTSAGDLVLALGEQHDEAWNFDRVLALADALTDNPDNPHLIEGTRLWWREQAAALRAAPERLRAQLEQERQAAVRRQQDLTEQLAAAQRMASRVHAAHQDDLEFRTIRQTALSGIADRKIRHARWTAAGALVLAVAAAVTRRR